MANFVIIGGSSGIGKSTVDLLKSQGHNVYASYNNNPPSSAPSSNYFHLNVNGEFPNPDFLPETIDGLVYCPGSIVLKPFHRLKPEDFKTDYELQVIGAVRSIQWLLPKMRNSNGASIVLFSTVAARQGFNFHSLVSSSKAALEGLTVALAAEYAPQIRVNAIAPSLTDTALADRFLNTEQKKEMHQKNNPMKRIGRPEDLANMAAFLLSSSASWVNGQILHVDGGKSTLQTN